MWKTTLLQPPTGCSLPHPQPGALPSAPTLMNLWLKINVCVFWRVRFQSDQSADHGHHLAAQREVLMQDAGVCRWSRLTLRAVNLEKITFGQSMTKGAAKSCPLFHSCSYNCLFWGMCARWHILKSAKIRKERAFLNFAKWFSTETQVFKCIVTSPGFFCRCRHITSKKWTQSLSYEASQVEFPAFIFIISFWSEIPCV